MYKTPAGSRLHIGIFGRRNVGKSSLINALAGQSLAIVSDIPGTTTDPVYKTMEINPIGPCILIDTAGLDDSGLLGAERVKKTLAVLRKTDFGLIILEPQIPPGEFEENLVRNFREKNLPFIFVINKSDLDAGHLAEEKLTAMKLPFIRVSSTSGAGLEELKEKIIILGPDRLAEVPLVADLVRADDIVVLVCPIDGAMPQGRLILPQVQVLRDLLDAGATGFVTKDSQLPAVLAGLKEKPRLVITDSQVFETVSRMVPVEIPLTSFSILFARHRGDINAYLKGAQALGRLVDGDEILISEACTHHVQPEDIGRSKIPSWLLEHTGKELQYEVTAGGDFPEDLRRFKLIIQCGGCMVNRREILARVSRAASQNIPIINYGILMARIFGLLPRVMAPLKGGVVKIDAI